MSKRAATPVGRALSRKSSGVLSEYSVTSYPFRRSACAASRPACPAPTIATFLTEPSSRRPMTGKTLCSGSYRPDAPAAQKGAVPRVPKRCASAEG